MRIHPDLWDVEIDLTFLAWEKGSTMNKTFSYLEMLSRETDKSESEVMTIAFQKGVQQMWRERILGRYLLKEITRDEAIETVGVDWVELAECQHEAMMEDIAWAMGG